MTAAHRSSGQRGFTLIELLLVMAILLILGVLGVAVMRNYNRKALMTASVANLRAIGAVVSLAAADDHGRWCYFSTNGDRGSAMETGAYSTPILAHPTFGGYVGAGRLLPYLRTLKPFLDPAMPTYRAKLMIPWDDWERNGNAIQGHYITRGFQQSYVGADTSVRPGRYLYNVTDRAIISSFFMYHVGGGDNFPLSPTGTGWAVLYGDGSIVQLPIPSWIDKNSPPEIWNNSTYQYRIWDYFDSARRSQ